MQKLKRLEAEQINLASKVIRKDAFPKLELIGGIETGSKFNKLFCSIVVCDYNTMQVVEKKILVQACTVPYISGFRALRDLEIMLEAYNKLETKPDLLLIGASGILHPRRLGLASHIGVMLDQPTIGITKSLLTGRVVNDDIVFDHEVLGKAVVTKEKSKPIYVSIGHKVSLDKSMEIVKSCIRHSHKMPEPLHLAHKFVKSEMKN